MGGDLTENEKIIFGEKEIPLRDLKYSESWELIMGVVEKIENTDCSKFAYSWAMDGELQYNYYHPIVEIAGSTCWIYFDCVLDPPFTINDISFKKRFDSKLLAVYEGVCEFIEWYNFRIKND